jgi:hypothetical protein
MGSAADVTRNLLYGQLPLLETEEVFRIEFVAVTFHTLMLNVLVPGACTLTRVRDHLRVGVRFQTRSGLNRERHV